MLRHDMPRADRSLHTTLARIQDLDVLRSQHAADRSCQLARPLDRTPFFGPLVYQNAGCGCVLWLRGYSAGALSALLCVAHSAHPCGDLRQVGQERVRTRARTCEENGRSAFAAAPPIADEQRPERRLGLGRPSTWETQSAQGWVRR